jgi:hypothetical protein
MELLRARVLDKGAYVRQRALQVSFQSSAGSGRKRGRKRHPLIRPINHPNPSPTKPQTQTQTNLNLNLNQKPHLKVWAGLVQAKCVPLSWWNLVVGLGVSRLEDESQLVIRAALRLLFECIKSNPFSPALSTDRFAATLAHLEGQLREMGPGPREEGGEGDGDGGAEGGAGAEDEEKEAGDAKVRGMRCVVVPPVAGWADHAISVCR